MTADCAAVDGAGCVDGDAEGCCAGPQPQSSNTNIATEKVLPEVGTDREAQRPAAGLEKVKIVIVHPVY